MFNSTVWAMEQTTVRKLIKCSLKTHCFVNACVLRLKGTLKTKWASAALSQSKTLPVSLLGGRNWCLRGIKVLSRNLRIGNWDQSMSLHLINFLTFAIDRDVHFKEQPCSDFKWTIKCHSSNDVNSESWYFIILDNKKVFLIEEY